MASANSLRSLVRPTIPIVPRLHPVVLAVASTTPASAVASFSTTGKSLKAPRIQLKSSAVQVKPKRGGAAGAPGSRKPAPGERKAYRKRIQLSNNSALAVEGHDALAADTLLQGANAGKMFVIPDELVDQLRTVEAFKATQMWNLFRKPHVLARKEVLDLVSRLESAAKNKEAAKIVLTGSRLSGKSLALLQAMSYALLNKWVVINIPEAHDLTNGNTEYSPIPDTEPMQFSQPVYVMKLLQNILKGNKKVLDGLKIEKEWTLTGQKKGDSLADLVMSCKEAEFAWPTFSALWTELTLPGRPPLFLGLDGLSHINKLSAYKDPSFKPVHAHDLTLVRTFVDALSGKTKLPNGGAVVASTSGNNMEFHPSQELVLSQLEAGQAGKEVPKPNPYERRYDERVYDALKNAYVLRLEGISHDEAKSLMGYWGASGLLRAVVNTRTVSEKRALGGQGLVGELERVSLMTMRM